MVQRTILVTGAGGGGSNNLIESIRRSGCPVRIVGSNCDRFFAFKSAADVTYELPLAQSEHYLGDLCRLIDAEGVELVVPNSDREVREISAARDKLPCRVFLPDHEVVLLCQDKFTFYEKVREWGLPMARTFPIEEIRDLEEIFRAFEGHERLWIRMRRGSGSKGATSIADREQAEFWLRYWETMRGVSPSEFTISEYLPGRDFAFESVWKGGRLLAGKLAERLSYLFGENRVSGVSSSPNIARLVREPSVVDLCIQLIRAIDPRPHGNYNVDLKCDREGRPNVTEINIGRFFMITPIFDWSGKVNLAEMHLRAAFDAEVALSDPVGDIPEEETYLIREMDSLPHVTTLPAVDEKVRKIERRGRFPF